jgi:hypothetical protein
MVAFTPILAQLGNVGLSEICGFHHCRHALPNWPRKRFVRRGVCAPNYCRRYRPAARMAQPVDTSISHLGFRLIARGRDPGA